ncbi:MAG: branched-chain amino acid ABC transporter permease [Aeromicrobium sp.]
MEWINALIQGVLLGGLYALLATGLSLAFGVMRLVNLAHGDLIILAAYLALVVTNATGINPFLSLPVVVPLMMLLGYALQRGLLNRALRSSGVMPPLMVTFGLAIVIQNLLLDVFSADSQGLTAGPIENDSITINDQISIGVLPLLTLIVAVAILIGLELMISRTALGRALRATADDPEAAGIVGIDHQHMYAIAMAIALSTVAVAGVFVGVRSTFSPSDGSQGLIIAFESVIIGGLGSLWGTLVGGVALGVAQAFGNQISPAYQILAGHLLFLAVLFFRPTGLLARRTQRQV